MITRKMLPASGDWAAKLLVASQVAIGLVALVALLAAITLHPYLLLGFAILQGLTLVGVVLFAIVVIFAQRAMVPETYGPGEVIFEEGAPGRGVYVITSGNVELFMKDPAGAPRVVARLGPGEHFGEMALLGHVPRNATARTVTAVEVMKMARSDFVSFYTTLPGVKEHFNKIVESRLKELQTFRDRT